MNNYIETRAKERGIPMIDSDETLEVNVTAEDCRRGNKKNPHQCALARAIMRTQKKNGAIASYFLRTTAWIEFRDKLVRYRLPKSAQKEIVSFDRGGGFVPGDFRLGRVPQSDRKDSEIYKRRVQRTLENRRKRAKQRLFHHHTEVIRNIVNDTP